MSDKMVIYFADKDAMWFVPYCVDKPAAHNEKELVCLTLQKVIEGPPEGSGLFGTVPKDTKIIDLDIKDDFVVLNFNKEYEENYVGGTCAENYMINSMVYTLAQFHKKYVKFLIEGEERMVLGRGHLALDEPIRIDTSHMNLVGFSGYDMDRKPSRDAIIWYYLNNEIHLVPIPLKLPYLENIFVNALSLMISPPEGYDNWVKSVFPEDTKLRTVDIANKNIIHIQLEKCSVKDSCRAFNIIKAVCLTFYDIRPDIDYLKVNIDFQENSLFRDFYDDKQGINIRKYKCPNP